MEDKRDFIAADGDSDATLVTPRFDDVEAETARPVVPLAEVPADEVNSVDSLLYGGQTDAPVYATRAPKRSSWTLALVLLSTLVGTVLGGAGLRLYQQRQRAAATTVAAEPATPAQVETVQPSPPQEAVEEAETAVLSATIIEDPGDPEEAPASRTARDDREDDVEKRDEKRDEKSNESAKPAKSPEKERDEERRRKDEDDDRAAERAKGKTPEARRVDVLTPAPPRAVGTQVGQSGEAESEPQQVERDREEILNERRQRRREQRERRARQQRDVDRVRGIFEGQP